VWYLRGGHLHSSEELVHSRVHANTKVVRSGPDSSVQAALGISRCGDLLDFTPLPRIRTQKEKNIVEVICCTKHDNLTTFSYKPSFHLCMINSSWFFFYK